MFSLDLQEVERKHELRVRFGESKTEKKEYKTQVRD